jgi:hypothetical protein
MTAIIEMSSGKVSSINIEVGFRTSTLLASWK